MHYPIDNPVIFDAEVFPRWLEFGFRITSTGEDRQYVIPTGDPYGHGAAMVRFVDWVLHSNYPFVGFNSNAYDDLILTRFLETLDPQAAFLLSQDLIVNGKKPWEFNNGINSIDLMTVLPGRMSLKKLGVCLGHTKLQELPIAYNKTPSPEEVPILLSYNTNDLDITEKLYHAIYPEIKLRRELSLQYKQDLRSKGEAALAESILLYELGQRGHKNSKRDLNRLAWEIHGAGSEVQVFRPHWWHALVNEKLPIVEAVGEEVFLTPIEVDDNGRLAKGSIDTQVFIDDRYYQMGVGGLHSIDGPGAWVPNDDEVLYDIDVASYYPNIVLTNRLYPRQWSEVFLDIYQDIVTRRLEAKRNGDKTTADVLKIAANGTYGKSSEVYSSLYDPQLTANVTLLGQLGLLTLIEMLVGTASVCSANTDGITVLCKRAAESRMRELVTQWEAATGLEMEFTEYSGLYQRDVNSYIALKPGGGVKTKGAFLDQWPDLRHTPSANIVATAVKNYLAKGTPVEETIRGCTDLNQFILTQVVTGETKTQWRGQPLGKILRFYKSTRGDAAPIMRISKDGAHSMVPDSDGCIPVEDLPQVFPVDLNYRWYEVRANDQVSTITRRKRPGMNRWAEIMYYAGLTPALVQIGAQRLSAAASPRGQTDFTSIDDDEGIGVKTGDGVIGMVRADGSTRFYRTTKHYPTKTRAKVMSDHGFELHYRTRVPHTGHISLLPEVDFDKFYTAAELRKVGR